MTEHVLVKTFTAGEALEKGDVVWLNTDGKVYKGGWGTTGAPPDILGAVLSESASAGESVEVGLIGIFYAKVMYVGPNQPASHSRTDQGYLVGTDYSGARRVIPLEVPTGGVGLARVLFA